MCWNFEDRDVSGKDGGLFVFIIAGSGLLGLTTHSSGGFFTCVSGFFVLSWASMRSFHAGVFVLRGICSLRFRSFSHGMQGERDDKGKDDKLKKKKLGAGDQPELRFRTSGS